MTITRTNIALFAKCKELEPSLDGIPNPGSSVLNVMSLFVSVREVIGGIAFVCIMKC